jgi:hypothetical protein
MSTYLYEMRVNWDGSTGIVDFDAPEGTIQSAVVEVVGLLDSNGTPYTPTYQINDTVISVTIASGSYSLDGAGQLYVNIRQSKGFQDSTGTFVSGTCTSIAPNLPPTLNIDQSQVGVVKFNFGIPRGENGKNGKSAFEVAQDNGWTGTDFAWMQTLKGESAYAIAKANGYVGLESAWVASLKGGKGERGIDGPSGDNAYSIARMNGFVGTVGQWLASLKGEKGDAGPSGTAVLPYKELASGTLWYCRPRVLMGNYTSADLSTTYKTAEVTSNFIIEDGLFEDSLAFEPEKSWPDKPAGSKTVIPRYTKTPVVGVHEKGRYTSGNTAVFSTQAGEFIDSVNSKMFGWYYVLLSPEESDKFTEGTLKNIEVDVSGVTQSGNEITNSGQSVASINTGKEKGLLFPFYKGASIHTSKVNGKTYVALWFRVMTYAQRRNGTTTADVFEWDGIGTDGWDLDSSGVHWWSTNVAQGMKFTAKVRN